jgi:ABC-2 type transport system ATP-binding protein
MLGAPPVLVLDEPTNGLDPDGIAEMRRFLRDLPARTGATVLLSSHLLGEIEQIATHVGVIHQGRLVLEGELSVLKAAGAPEIHLRADDHDRAAAVLAGHDLTVAKTSEGLSARLRPGQDHDAVTARLNRALVEQGVSVFAIGARAHSLEALYRQVTEAAQPMPEAA